jgi:hypothetical protein
MKNLTPHKFYHTSMALSSHSSEYVVIEKGVRLMEINTQITFVPGRLFPLLRLVCDMLRDFGYSPINAQFLELLCTDLKLLAVMQLIAFRIRGQEVNTCQK